MAFLRSLRTWVFIAWLGTFAVVAYGLHRLEPYARSIKIADTAIEWVGVPDWLSEENWKDVLGDLEARVDLDPETQPYDDTVCSWVAQRLAGSAWIERIRRVSKQNDGRVKVQAEFRKPFAMVENDGVAYLVDAIGVRLPAQWASSGLNRVGWLAIRGARATVPRAGERWVGGDVAAGLKLARFLYHEENAGRMPFRESIVAIDVSNFGGRKDPRAGRLQLVTINPRSCIHWGSAPGQEHDVESTAELKLAMLCRLYEEGRLPDRVPIDVRADDGIWLREPE
jgi:hypothetical protein